MSTDALMSEPLRISIVDLSGETTIKYTPLAAMCLKAAIETHGELSARCHVTIHPFLQSHLVAEMIDELREAKPDVLAMSCQGWNMRQLEQTFGSLKQILPDTMLILGGNHVSGRAEQILSKHASVDMVVNGEGEFTICELLLALTEGRFDFREIKGLSYRGEDGAIVTTDERIPIRQMELLASPYLHAGIDLSSFDVALLETNRGCPYHCAFCYWGGRVGQKLALGELERVRQDLKAIGKAGIETIFLCDANFGILKQDVEIAKMVVEVKELYGAPREFNVNWAKNHATRVGEIIRILQDGGIHTAINVPLQTMSLEALKLADRTEAGRAAMIEEARAIVSEGSEVFCELIFGLPGETLESFKTNYDVLLHMFPVLRIHPLWILPNTTYDHKRAELGIKTISPDMNSDYEAVYEHLSMTSDDIRDGLAILLAHSNINLLGLGRNALHGLTRLGDYSAAETLVKFEHFLSTEKVGLGHDLYKLYQYIRRSCYFERHLRDTERQLLYRSRDEAFDLMRRFVGWLEPDEDVRGIVVELARLDAALLPRIELDGEGRVESVLHFDFDVLELSRRLRVEDAIELGSIRNSAPVDVTMSHKAGMAKLEGSNCDLTGSWNGRICSSKGSERAAELSPA